MLLYKYIYFYINTPLQFDDSTSESDAPSHAEPMSSPVKKVEVGNYNNIPHSTVRICARHRDTCLNLTFPFQRGIRYILDNAKLMEFVIQPF